MAAIEKQWADFIERGAAAMAGASEDEAAWARRFTMAAGETARGRARRYEQVARRTDALVATLPDLDASHALPQAPWFEPGARWSARRVFLHIIAETAQHAGHADILRETLDGAEDDGLTQPPDIWAPLPGRTADGAPGHRPGAPSSGRPCRLSAAPCGSPRRAGWSPR